MYVYFRKSIIDTRSDSSTDDNTAVQHYNSDKIGSGNYGNRLNITTARRDDSNQADAQKYITGQ